MMDGKTPHLQVPAGTPKHVQDALETLINFGLQTRGQFIAFSGGKTPGGDDMVVAIGFGPCADLLDMEASMLVDLKSARTAQPENFGRQAFDLGYPLQLAHYRRGFEVAGWPIEQLRILAVEKEPPYAVSVFEPDPEWLAYGEHERQTATLVWADCIESDRYPAYGDEVQSLSLPRWVK